ncbi:MAG: hypothetical protein LBN12_01330 [Clostridiales Family XIII bacterium]|jgi:hypothetical protein|nr:hypothetical protein [Clostridiales Family XIII bacterium]
MERRLTRGGRDAFPDCPPEIRKIGFVGLSAGAGTTTLTLAAAECFAAGYKASHRASPVAYLEIAAGPDEGSSAGLPYDKIGIDRHFAGRDFLSFYRLAAEGKPVSGKVNLSGGVNWALRMPVDVRHTVGAASLLRLIDNIEGAPVVCDISSSLSREALLDVLADMHRIICVVDPLPSKLLAGGRVMEQVRSAEHAGIPVTYVLNKMNAGVNLREVKRFVSLNDPVEIPAVKLQAVYAAEYACRSLADEPCIRGALANIFAFQTQNLGQVS